MPHRAAKVNFIDCIIIPQLVQKSKTHFNFPQEIAEKCADYRSILGELGGKKKDKSASICGKSSVRKNERKRVSGR